MRITTTSQYAALAGLFLMYSGAFAGDVKVFPVKGIEVGKYQTYQWMPVRIVTKQGILEDDDVIAPEIRKAVNRELQSKGYKEIAEEGQLQVRCVGLSVASNQLEGYLVGWGWATGWGWAPTTTTAVSRINWQGTVALALFDPTLKQIVWSGYASEALNPNEIDKTINKATTRLFKKLPVRK
jgi:hypothetical protein